MKKAILGALFVGAMFASCSSDEPVVDNGGNNEGKDLGYVAVNISQPKSVGGRAASTGFEYGTADENKAATALFYIFKNDGSLNNSQTIALSGEGEGTNPEVERIYNAVLVIDGVSTEPTVADNYEIVCVLNAPSTLDGTESLSELRAKVANFGISEAGKFIMTNTVYNGADGKEVCGAKVDGSKIKTSAAEATNDPVEIYVERVVAKVNATKSANFENGNTDKVTINGVETNGFTIKITGFEIANIAQSSNLIKDIDDLSFTWSWNDVTNHRTYWENMPESMTYSNKSYNSIATTDFDWSKFTGSTEYIQPNTGSQNTAVLVTAQLMDGESAADLVWMKGGYFDNTSAMNMICQMLANAQYAVKYYEDGATTPSYRSIDTPDLVWKNKKADGTAVTDLKDYQAVAQVKAFENGETVVKYNFTTKAEVTETSPVSVNEYLCSQTSYFAEVFTDGKCYYFVNIDQKGVVSDLTDSKPGVVRNHIYDLSLNSIQGIGTAVFDPDKVIIPDTPKHDKFYYLAAEINVLAWKLVSQGVDFGKTN